MKERRNQKIEIRFTEREKQELQDYAAAHDITVSELVRMALYKVMAQKEEKQ